MIGTRPEPGQPAGPCCVARPPRGPPSRRRSCSAQTRARPRYFTAPEEFELYDLESDPDEMHNLYGEAAHQDLSGQLAARLTELRANWAIGTSTNPPWSCGRRTAKRSRRAAAACYLGSGAS